MSNKRFLHYDDKGNAIQLSGKHKDNRQDKSDHQRMIERWRRAVGQPPIKVENGNLNVFR